MLSKLKNNIKEALKTLAIKTIDNDNKQLAENAKNKKIEKLLSEEELEDWQNDYRISNQDEVIEEDINEKEALKEILN